MSPPAKPDLLRAGAARSHPLPLRDQRAIAQAQSLHDDASGPSIAIAEGVARRNPDSAEAWQALTMALFSPYKQLRCRAALARWRELAPDDPDILAVEAGLAYSSTEHEEALAWARLALEARPDSFEMLWIKAMCERFLRRPERAATLAAANRTNPGRYAEEAERLVAVERFGPLEAQHALERIILVGAAANEGDVGRAKRLLALSEAQGFMPAPWVEFRAKMKARIADAERRQRRRPAPKPAPARPRRRRGKPTRGAQ